MSIGCMMSVQSRLFFFAKEYTTGSKTGPNTSVVTVLFNVIIIASAEKLARFSISSPQAMVTAQAVLAIKLVMPNRASFQGELIVGALSSPCLCFM
jgi:preprotein translocase subunit Sec63